MTAGFLNEHWLIDGIGWVHVLGPDGSTFHVSEPTPTHRSAAERLRLCCLASDIVNGIRRGRVLARAKLKPGRSWEACA